MTGRRLASATGSSATRRTRDVYNRRASSFDAMAWGWEKLIAARIRRTLWSEVHGRVLELGVGTGANLAYYGRNTQVTAVDLSDRMLARARNRAAGLSSRASFALADAAHLPFERSVFDAAVATFVFCSVSDPVRSIQELCRVVRPGGRIFLVEQVRVATPGIGTALDLLDPLIHRPCGAHVARRTAEFVEAGGARLLRNEPYGPFGFVRLIVARVPADSE